MSDNDARSAPHASSAAPEVMDGIRSLHERIDELHRLVAQRLEAEGMEAGPWLHARAQTVYRPAWRRKTEGEIRWPVAVITLVVARAVNILPS